MTPHDFFDVELEWAQSTSGFALRSDDRDPLARACRRAVEERLFRPHGLIDVGAVVAEGRPFWTLLHLNAGPQDEPMWCFVEQGRGGCRASLLHYSRHHPAQVWQAGHDLARTPAGAGKLDPGLGRAVLAAVAANESRIALPAGAEDNAELIGAVLTVLPRRVASSWVWSTHLFGSADRFVAGRLGERTIEPAARADGPMEALVGELDGRPGPVTEAARDSRAERLSAFLAELGAPGAAVVHRASARVPAGPPAPPPAAPPAHPAEDPSESTQPLPSASELARGPALELVWAEWATIGTGFERLGGPTRQAELRRYFAAAEPLLGVEKVPNGVEDTLRYPLWTLRRVNVEGVGTHWCFVERGRGNLLGEDRQVERDRQFGMAGGCRFGFAPFGERPVDVWAAGEAERWTPVDERPGQPDGRLLARLLAALGAAQQRVCLPGDPAQNRTVIEAALAVLPGPLVARWSWSTCLFEPIGWYVAGAAPADLHGSDSIARLARQVAEHRLPAGPEGYLAGLDDKQREAFDWLVKAAGRSTTRQSIRAAFLQLVRHSTASGLTEFLTDMANTIKFSQRRPEEVQTALLTRDGRRSLHNNDADAVTEYAEQSPEAAHRHLVAEPQSEVATELLAGLRNRQLANPQENVFGLPTAGPARPPGNTRRALDLLMRRGSVAERAELVRAITQPGGFLHDWPDLAAAESHVHEFGLTWQQYPQFYPARIVDNLLKPAAVDGVTQRGLRLSPDRAALLREAARLLKRPDAAKAALIMAELYWATNGDPAQLRATAGTLLATRRKAERPAFWAAVTDRYEFRKVAEPLIAAVFAAGVAAMHERNGRRPLQDDALFQLDQRYGSAGTGPIEPARRRRAWLRDAGDWAHGVRVRRAERRRATRRRVSVLVVLLILLVAVLALVVFQLASNGGGPVDDTRSPSAPASRYAGPTPTSGLGGPGPASIGPMGPNAPNPVVTGPGRRSTAR